MISSTHTPDLDNANVGKPVEEERKGNLPNQGRFPYFFVFKKAVDWKKGKTITS